MARRSGPSNSQLLALAWGLGWRIAAGLLIGGYADGKLATAPLFTLTLSIAALVSGVMAIIRLLERSRSGDSDGGSGTSP